MPYTQAQIADVFRRQAEGCQRLGSPIHARLIANIADDVVRRGPYWRFLESWDGDLEMGALALRVAGALHYLALKGEASELAALFPSCGGTPAFDKLLPAALATIERLEEKMRPFLARPPQTNEVGRSAILLCGFLEAARVTGLPLRPREIGSSAGLNQCWDLYDYEIADEKWAQVPSPLTLRPDWRGNAAPLDQRVTVASRGGCDLDPLDIRDPDVRLRLQAYVWPDQDLRLANLRNALQVALKQDVRVERASAADWTCRQLAKRPAGQCIVIYHSIVRQYFPPAESQAFEDAIVAAGQAATRERPVAWLRAEQTAYSQPFELRLTVWPTGEDRLLAHAHPHGAIVKWLA
jgi:hypothetical protein